MKTKIFKNVLCFLQRMVVAYVVITYIYETISVKNAREHKSVYKLLKMYSMTSLQNKVRLASNFKKSIKFILSWFNVKLS